MFRVLSIVRYANFDYFKVEHFSVTFVATKIYTLYICTAGLGYKEQTI